MEVFVLLDRSGWVAGVYTSREIMIAGLARRERLNDIKEIHDDLDQKYLYTKDYAGFGIISSIYRYRVYQLDE